LIGGLAVLLCGAGLVGCGSSRPTAEVSGQITFEKKAPDVEGLVLSFMPADGQAVAFELNKDGTFKGKAVPVGENRLSLVFAGDGPSAVAPQITAKRAAQKTDSGKNALQAAGLSIPKNFQSPLTSGKKLVVEAGKENLLDWDINK
jgi:hypothetical protein